MFLRRLLCNRSALLKRAHPLSCTCCSARMFSSAVKVKRPNAGTLPIESNYV